MAEINIFATVETEQNKINAAIAEMGPRGPKGEAATIELGTVTTGAAGTDVIITNSGNEHNAVFNFTIPRGDKGLPGDDFQIFDNVAAMKANTSLENGMLAETKGYYTENDGGSANYIIRTKSNSDIEDNGLIIFLQNNLVAELITGENINVKQFGAKGDNSTDDRAAIQNAINAASPSGTVYFPKGKYIIGSAGDNNHGLIIPDLYSAVKLQGEGRLTSIIANTPSNLTSLLCLANGRSGSIAINNIQFDCNSKADYGIYSDNNYVSHLNINTVVVCNALQVGYYFATYVSYFFACKASNCPIGFKIMRTDPSEDGNTSCAFVSCSVNDYETYAYYIHKLVYSSFIACAADNGTDTNATAYYFNYVRGVNISGCGCENTKYAIELVSGESLAINGFDTYSVGKSVGSSEQLILIKELKNLTMSAVYLNPAGKNIDCKVRIKTNSNGLTTNVTILDNSIVDNDIIYEENFIGEEKPVTYCRDVHKNNWSNFLDLFKLRSKSGYDNSALSLVGTPTITSDGILTSTSSGNLAYFTKPFKPNEAEFSIFCGFHIGSTWSSEYIMGGGNTQDTDGPVWLQTDSTEGVLKCLFRTYNADNTVKTFAILNNNILKLNTDYLFVFNYKKDENNQNTYTAIVYDLDNNKIAGKVIRQKDNSNVAFGKIVQGDNSLIVFGGAKKSYVSSGLVNNSVNLNMCGFVTNGYSVANCLDVNYEKAYSNYTKIGSPTVDTAGWLSGTSANNTIQLSTFKPSTSAWSFEEIIKLADTWERSYFNGGYDEGKYPFIFETQSTEGYCQLVLKLNNGGTATGLTLISAGNYLTAGHYYKLKISCTKSNTDYVYKADIIDIFTGENVCSKTATRSYPLYQENDYIPILGEYKYNYGAGLTNNKIYLPSVKFMVNNEVVIQPLLTIPYYQNKNTKIALSEAADIAKRIYDIQGYTTYYIMDDNSQTFGNPRIDDKLANITVNSVRIRYDLGQTLIANTNNTITSAGYVYSSGTMTINTYSVPSDMLLKVYRGDVVYSTSSIEFLPEF